MPCIFIFIFMHMIASSRVSGQGWADPDADEHMLNDVSNADFLSLLT